MMKKLKFYIVVYALYCQYDDDINSIVDQIQPSSLLSSSAVVNGMLA